MSSNSVAIIIPTYNEADTIKPHLEFHSNHFHHSELILVDGGSNDSTLTKVEQSEAEPVVITISPGCRARQLSEGVRLAESDYLVLLHADTYLPGSFSVSTFHRSNAKWGWFDCRLDGGSFRDRVIERMISLRSAIFSSPTGDQAIWVESDLLESVGGVPKMPLMEDVKLSQKLRVADDGKRITTPVTTSSRRWQENGYLKTILTMWSLKLGYYMGINPRSLAQAYYGHTRK